MKRLGRKALTGLNSVDHGRRCGRLIKRLSWSRWVPYSEAEEVIVKWYADKYGWCHSYLWERVFSHFRRRLKPGTVVDRGRVVPDVEVSGPWCAIEASLTDYCFACGKPLAPALYPDAVRHRVYRQYSWNQCGEDRCAEIWWWWFDGGWRYRWKKRLEFPPAHRHLYVLSQCLKQQAKDNERERGQQYNRNAA